MRTMRIKKNPNKSVVEEVEKALKENDGYCPCAFPKTEDTKCMCKEFRERETPGECYCGLYVRELVNESFY